ncbi:MAG: YceI family protein [Cyclobacteriaceae bacterium]|nr:YceI family protein [Cyclobacteriaceae bacterium]
MNTMTKYSFFLFLILAVAACNKPGDSLETAEAQAVVAGAGDTLSVDLSTTTVSWIGYKPTGKHLGKIPVSSGFLTVANNSITGGSFSFDVVGLSIEDLAADSEDYGKLYGHLQSPDFFDAANHPTASFEITEVSPFAATDKITDKQEFSSANTPATDSSLTPANPSHWISGNLTLRGTTKNIKFPASVSITGGVVTAKAGFNIDRTAWNLSYGNEASAANKAKDQFIYNTVSLVLDINAK